MEELFQLQEDCYNQSKSGFEKEIELMVLAMQKEFGVHLGVKWGKVKENTKEAHKDAKDSEYDLVLEFKDFVRIRVIEGNIVKDDYPLDFYKLTVRFCLKEIFGVAPGRFLDCLEAELTYSQKQKYAPIDFSDYFHVTTDKNDLVYLPLKDNHNGNILIYNKATLKANKISKEELKEIFKRSVLLEDEGKPLNEKMKTFITKNTASVANIEKLRKLIIDSIVRPRMEAYRQTEEYREDLNSILEAFPDDYLYRAATINEKGENSAKHKRRGIKHETMEKCKIIKTIEICKFKQEVF
jgi:hypothetical protein